MKFSTYSESDRQEIEALFPRTFADSEGQSEGKLIGQLAHELMIGTETDDILGFNWVRPVALSHSIIPGIGEPVARTGNHITICVRRLQDSVHE